MGEGSRVTTDWTIRTHPTVGSGPQEQTVGLVKDVFTSAAERDIYTGDAVQIQIITKDGIETQMFPLRRYV